MSKQEQNTESEDGASASAGVEARPTQPQALNEAARSLRDGFGSLKNDMERIIERFPSL